MLELATTIEKLTTALAKELMAHGIPPEFAEEIAPELTQEFASFELPPSDPGTLSLLVGRYAIRKDDFKVFDALMDGLKAAAGVSFFTAHQPVLGAHVAIAVSLAKLLRSLAMRGVFLDQDTFHVLTILKCNVVTQNDLGLTSNEILEIVRRNSADADLNSLEQRLDFLKEVPTRDGATAKLVSADSSGRWRPHA
jgi:hypothetical protein